MPGAIRIFSRFAHLLDSAIATPLKGSLLVYNGSRWVNIPPPIDGQFLVGDSTTQTGLAWIDGSIESPEDYSPSLDFSDARNSGYLALFLPRLADTHSLDFSDPQNSGYLALFLPCLST